MKNSFVLKGHIVHAPKMDVIEIIEDGYMPIEDGTVGTICRRYDGGLPVQDYGNSLIIPGLCDMHVHASQYAMRGMGLDMELLPWLNAYTFPEESKFADETYAREVYARFAHSIVGVGTTRTCVFGTIHTDTVMILMEELEKAGVTAYVGKVNMDRNAPDSLREGTRESIAETERWLALCEGRFAHVFPMVTPRFVPSCTSELLEELGKIAGKNGLPVQSHLSESRDEVAWVKELEPESAYYGQVYEQHGLFGNGVKTVMAHCVHCSDEEMRLVAKNGVLMAHCPDSNSNLASGVANVRGMLDEGVEVALGSDLAGGCSMSILDAAANAVRVSKMRETRGGGHALSLAEAFYMATTAGAKFFGDRGGFAEGTPLHAVVLEDEKLVNTEKLTVLERLQRMLYLYEDRRIAAVYANGKKIV